MVRKLAVTAAQLGGVPEVILKELIGMKDCGALLELDTWRSESQNLPESIVEPVGGYAMT
jgi:hypothetical protein